MARGFRAVVLLWAVSLASTRADPLAGPASPVDEEQPITDVAPAPVDLPAPVGPPAPRPPRPAPYRARGADAVREDAACASCHAIAAREWASSGHRTAFTDPAFQTALAIEDSPFCRGCHAPEADPRSAPSPEVAAIGVGCVTCHVHEAGAVLAAPARPGAARAPHAAPHAIVRSPDFAAVGACASCHEFSFPGASGHDDGSLMQSTVQEHARSAAADRPCASCHMPERGGRRSHAFAEVRDAAWLKGALLAEAHLDEMGTVVVTLRQTSPGHAFPTGDLFRRLEVGAELRGPRGEVLGRTVRYLARHFGMVPGERGRQLLRDDRLFDEPREIELDLPRPDGAPRGGEIVWWVTYQRVARGFEGKLPSEAEVESAVRLHAGRL